MFLCDNLAVCNIINKLTSKDEYVMFFVRKLVLKVIEYNIDIRSTHVPGSKNLLCDRLSRFQDDADLLEEYGLDHLPTQLPAHLKPTDLIAHQIITS